MQGPYALAMIEAMNSDNPTIALILDSGCEAELRPVLEKVLKEYALADACVIGTPSAPPAHARASLQIGVPDKAAAHIPSPDVFPKPVRIGAVLERIGYYLNEGSQPRKRPLLPLGPYELDITHGRLITVADRSILHLTEKECHILELLYAQGGRPLERKALLEKVWGYGEDIETHTLETHIYRLRQKIEKDPSAPEILLTDEQSYRLAVENGP